MRDAVAAPQIETTLTTPLEYSPYSRRTSAITGSKPPPNTTPKKFNPNASSISCWPFGPLSVWAGRKPSENTRTNFPATRNSPKRKLLRRWCLKMRRETYRNRPTNITNPSCSRPSTRPSPSAMSCTRSRSLTSCLPLPPPVSFLLPSPPAPPTAPKPYPLSQEQGSRGRPRALSSLC